ncbi:unnamed protein product [Vitrella brassicaformis CCMP3155]|uniref:RRM domain-containing protein n=3 Tax=Vitrella brassicaformis TaxID=1169539 RepID=A0A0G4E8M4_VITBC|nr:unnamed protein product [Vitrella brassicaformis CCMP3155]|eukprot:CEL92175.1 unnamed protein product [Vitrella brassicaformis CCMP3155]
MSAVGMPPHMLALFAARPPLEHLKPVQKRKMPPISGAAEFVEKFTDNDEPPARPPFETPKQRQARRKKEKAAQHAEELKQLIEEYDPNGDDSAAGDPFRTLFVSRISYGADSKTIRKEFEKFGPIKKVRMVKDLDGKFRGYCFIEFESERDMKNAYKHADGTKIDGRRVCVDVERGRTVEGWLPRRLGGGRGPPRGSVPPKPKTPVVAGGRGGDRRQDTRGGTQQRDGERSYRGGGGDSYRGGGHSYRGGGSGYADRDRGKDRNYERAPRDRERNGGERDQRDSYGHRSDRYSGKDDRNKYDSHRDSHRDRERSRSHDRRDDRRDRKRDRDDDRDYYRSDRDKRRREDD